MDLNVNLNISQEQKLVLTQQMKLSIDILQFSSLELTEFIEEKLEENPLLEKENRDSEELVEFVKELGKYEKNKYERIDYNNDYVSPLNFISKEESLYEFLLTQLKNINLSKEHNEILEYLINNIDEKGYLNVEVENVLKSFEIKENEYELCVKTLQSMEPTGIGARNLKECLNIQLKDKDYTNEVLFEIIDKHLDLIASNKYKELSQIYGIKIKEAQDLGDIIKKLEPKPARGFYTGEKIVYITPDVFIKNINGELIILLNERNAPNLQINNLYMNIINNENAKSEEKKYVKEKISEALNIIKGIDQRKSTLYQVSEKIVEKQKEYFLKGDMYLKPMILKEIALDLNLHESTISRAVKNKYLEGPKGVIAIKELFSASLKSNYDKEESSAKSIKSIIKNIINGENKKKPYSDNIISQMLFEQGVKISRRTVAKYREEMGILSTSKRKRF
ncbi:RNA polymerase factor sigma-54 [Oceanirhabdus seepicola]|uniref:RNA polymerase factor sigma-54 n=1 Tax=Oceanirhabdus seepicola TaxID=2828781 RepID=A0A9J6P112_9CLOT|nr:RNA polymerase factor sigma-54 [Oceanirhabdus seepicola]MCM1990418.1 RNA polymerase factor sigma-54 [Oceanirhabdus seepicola]